MSAATSIGFFWWVFSSQRASLPTVVVLPEPCRPHIMMPVGPLPLAHFSSVSTGPIILMSSSWQIAMKACSGVIVLVPYSWLFARSSICLPRACSFTRSRKRLTTLNSTSPSSSDRRTSRSASSMISSLSSATPVRRWRAARNPLARVSSTVVLYHTEAASTRGDSGSTWPECYRCDLGHRVARQMLDHQAVSDERERPFERARDAEPAHRVGRRRPARRDVRGVERLHAVERGREPAA